ncbi:MAG: CGNR zinc finger domain-containing protein [Ignavibacteria bacterium]|jgi:predicted RNA-binding Zn ribbon-like protein
MAENEIKKWKFVGGQISLDFINSVGGRTRQEGEAPLNYKIIADKLGNFADLVDWGNAIGILNESSVKKLNLFTVQNEKAAKKNFQRAIALREVIYKIFINLIEENEQSREDIDLLNNECAEAREQQKLFFDSNKFKWNFESDAGEPESIIRHIALSAAELLVSDRLHRVKECPGDNCGWLFLDTSKNGSRQWCDMKDCGNLAKVRRYRGKQK